VSTSSLEIEAEKGASGKGMLVNAPSHEKKLWRRGRPRKDSSKGEENHLSVKMKVRPAPEGSAMPTAWSGMVGTTSGGNGRRQEKAPGPPVESPTQQLEQANLAIAELYQENRELWHRLAEKDQEILSSQGHVGSTVWLQRRLREAQDTIVQLCEAQRMAEEKDTVQGMW
jgi:hypothetical protein